MRTREEQIALLEHLLDIARRRRKRVKQSGWNSKPISASRIVALHTKVLANTYQGFLMLLV